MQNLKYEIDEQNKVIIYECSAESFNSDEEEWFIFDTFDSYPNGTIWTKEQALDWADKYIQSIIDENAPYAPEGPNARGKSKFIEIEKELYKKELEDKGYTVIIHTNPESMN